MDREERNATLNAVFFKVGKHLYLETSVARNPSNEIAGTHQLSLRIPSRVVLTRGEMKIFPLDHDAVKRNSKALGFQDQPFASKSAVTADANAWHAVLSKLGAKLFSAEPIVVLKRNATKP